MPEALEAYSTRLTTVGAAKIVRAIFSGENVVFTNSLWGDANGENYEPETGQTELRNLCYTAGVEKFEINAVYDNMLDIHARLSTEVGGFTVREVGITDQDGDLFCVGCIPPAEKVVGNSLTTNEMDVVLHVVVADASVVSFTLSDSIQYLTQRDMDAHDTNVNAHKNLWIPGSFTATCDTDAKNGQKYLKCPEMLNQKPGTIVRCSFKNRNDSESTLNANQNGDYPAVNLDGSAAVWEAGDDIVFQYDGTRWVQLLNLSEEVRKRQEMRYYGICKTAGATQTKTVDIDGFRLADGVKAVIQFQYTNTHATSRLNISETGIKPLYMNGAQVPPDLFAQGAVLELQYDGERYNILGDQGAADASTFGRVRLADDADEEKGTGSGYAVTPAALAKCIQKDARGKEGGVATLDEEGKVPSSQLRGGWILSATAPEDVTMLWITTSGTMKYFDGTGWKNVLPVWG